MEPGPDPLLDHGPDVIAEQALHAAKRDPRNLSALLQAATAMFAAGQPNDAVHYARAAVAIDPRDFSALRTLSGLLSMTGELEEAESVARRAIARCPDDPEARLHLGGIQITLGRFHDAVENLVAHVRATDARPEGWATLSSALAHLGRTERALDAISRAIILRPCDLEYRLHRASLLTSRARFGDALVELDAAAAMAPKDARVHRMASGNYEALGDLTSAYAAARLAADLAPDDAENQRHLTHLTQAMGLPSARLGDHLVGRHSWSPSEGSVRRKARPAPSGGPAALIAERWQVVYAIMLRDMRIRFSRSWLGYFWAIFEPISHLMTLGVMFYLVNQGPPPVGTSLFAFYASGLIPYLMFAHIATEVMHARAGSGALLMLPRVKPTDIIAARSLLNLATEIAVGMIVFSAFGVLALSGTPSNFLRCAEATVLLALLGTGIGAINMVTCEILHSWETFFAAIVRLLYFGSGIYYSPVYMPDAVRRILEWNPVLQGVELFRTGFFHGYHPLWVHPEYLYAWAVTSLTIGLALERATRRKMRRPS